MSVLLPETREILRTARAGQPMFTQGAWETFSARHTIGPLRVLPRTCGGYVVIDERRPVGDRTLEVVSGSEDAAHAALERWAQKLSQQERTIP